MNLKSEGKWSLVVILLTDCIINKIIISKKFPKWYVRFCTAWLSRVSILCIEKMNSNEIYSNAILSRLNIQISQNCLEQMSPLDNFL